MKTTYIYRLHCYEELYDFDYDVGYYTTKELAKDAINKHKKKIMKEHKSKIKEFQEDVEELGQEFIDREIAERSSKPFAGYRWTIYKEKLIGENK